MSIYEETLKELRKVAQNGVGSLRKSIRTAEDVAPIKVYTPDEIRRLRIQNSYTQQYFAKLLGVSIKTVQAWESGAYKPGGAAMRLFQVLERDPHALDACALIKA